MIKLSDVAGQKFFILGLGKSGLAAAACLMQSGAEVALWDDKEPARLDAERGGCTVLNPAEADLTGATALVMAPGIPLTHPAPHPAVLKARAAGVPVIGDFDLLFRACPEATYVGITGTNGKSTTTALIAHILKTAGRMVQVGGNLGPPVLSLEPLGKDGVYVLESSSYQLDLLQTNAFNIAVLLNVTPDHIDRHGDLSGYIAAKERILQTTVPQTFVIGTEEESTQYLAKRAREKAHLKIEEISVTHAVDQGVMAADGLIKIVLDGKESSQPFIHQADLPALPGQHNAQNICAAIAACRALHLPDEAIQKGIKSFPGLAHRQQLIATIGGVRFVNDSKATNADAASKALACYDNIYWIIGGKPKAGGLAGLEPFMPRVRHAFLIGEASKEFASWCEGKIPHTSCETLDVAVHKAALSAWNEGRTGAVVLLSPACASFDQFSGFEERGETFADLVRKLPATGGSHASRTV